MNIVLYTKDKKIFNYYKDKICVINNLKKIGENTDILIIDSVNITQKDLRNKIGKVYLINGKEESIDINNNSITVLDGNKIEAIDSLIKLLNDDTYIKTSQDDFFKMINNKTYMLVSDKDTIYENFNSKKSLIKNSNLEHKILIHFIGSYMLSDIYKLTNKFMKYSDKYGIEITLSEGRNNFVSLYVGNNIGQI